ncbi:MAG: phosphatidylserine decarboxylase family protein [Acholeplasmataceae bacterium]|nr:phosphatidylserine decarboxylase family protein [Acholeplasmataceae bacterium]
MNLRKIKIVREGYPFVGISALITYLTAFFANLDYSVIPGALTVYFAYFFRNPVRKTIYDEDLLYAPADGTVMSVEKIFDEEYLNEEAWKVTIFLSVFDVHVNRSPMQGEIKYQRYTCGRFVPAYKKDASFENERHAIGIEAENRRVLVIQIAGILARRIVSWVTLGRKLLQGECYGMIKFGSSTEIIMPKKVSVLVKKGDKVAGGLSVIGKYDVSDVG